MKKSSAIAIGIAAFPAVLAMIVGVVVLALLVIKLVWAWAIPDLLPGAVKQGLVARDISWYTAFKLAVFVGVIFGFTGAFHNNNNK